VQHSSWPADATFTASRRAFLGTGLCTALGTPLLAGVREEPAAREEWSAAVDVLASATASGRVHAASLCVRHEGREFSCAFGAARTVDDLFLLASISKTISAAAVMTLYDRGEFRLDDPVRRFLPEFTGDGREKVTMRQLLTHVSGLPDQLPENARLRARHADLSEFVAGAIRTPLVFSPGSRYGYSSMGILLATDVARRISGTPFHQLVHEAVYEPLGMKSSAMGLGRFDAKSTMRCQVESAAPESGAGDPQSTDWDWNSSYWRKLGVPWGGAHGSAPDVARFLADFLHPSGKVLRPATSRTMIANHNREGVRPRGLGFDVGEHAGGTGCSERTFGHTGSTGTLCWADPTTDTICVVLTTLPGRAIDPHPRHVASDHVSKHVSRSSSNRR
jgi:CubicO group peptidase (beta-lactamase class C family)